MAPVMKGVKKLIKKPQIQLDAVATDMALDLTLSGKVSEIKTYAIGAHVVAKQKM